MDRVLNKLPISKNNLQLLAATCTFLASKLREPSTHALQPEVLIYYTDNSITKRDLMSFFCVLVEMRKKRLKKRALRLVTSGDHHTSFECKQSPSV
ncbi:CLUMA_CG017868, isoform A [Clunio marinus]|uniref:CLUMA_CG017868, isoform A n=1 Tax=Clunio marinus TaxID=568069 RepID=A0A1J1IXD7_9DIPT|nr:CLUMA_CG017868, isoform A [Clunio marinus]